MKFPTEDKAFNLVVTKSKASADAPLKTLAEALIPAAGGVEELDPDDVLTPEKVLLAAVKSLLTQAAELQRLNEEFGEGWQERFLPVTETEELKLGEMTMESDIYTENGHENRDDYLEYLADDYGVDKDTVYAMADLLGPTEDFDGLVSMLREMNEGVL